MFTIYYSDEEQYKEFNERHCYYFRWDELGFAGKQSIHNWYDDTSEDNLNLIIDLDANDSTLQFLEESGFEIRVTKQFDFDTVADGLAAYDHYVKEFVY